MQALGSSHGQTAEVVAFSHPGWCSGSPWVRAASGRWCVQRLSAWTLPDLTKPALLPSRCSRVSVVAWGRCYGLGTNRRGSWCYQVSTGGQARPRTQLYH